MPEFPLIPVIFGLIGLAIYCIPSAVAFRRNHPNRWIIFTINMAFGATVIGWIGALVWASNAVHLSNLTDGSHGGESGLNLFVNDVKRARWSEPDATASLSIPTGRSSEVRTVVDELERLRHLLADRHITADEFDRLKASILASL